jgi:hypothetical protein
VILTSRSFGTLGIGLVAILIGAAVANGDSSKLVLLCGAIAGVALVIEVAKRSSFGIPTLAFLIAAFPVARVVLHGVPIYGTDVLALLLVAGALRLGGELSGYAWVVVVYLASWVVSWLHELLSLQLVLAPTYGLIRNVLAVSIFFPAYLAAKKYGGQTSWVIALAVGASVTAFLALFQDVASSPANRVLQALAPNFTTSALKTYPNRAFALFTAPTTLAGFFTVATLLLIAASNAVERRQRKYVLVATFLCVLGMLATYSRQWVPALAAGLVALAWMRLGMSRRVIAAAAVTLFVASLLLSTGVLSSSYLDARFSTLGTSDVNVQTRISRQKTFISLVKSDPTTFAVGKGFAGQDLVARGLVSAPAADTLRTGLNDNVFLLEVFNHGIVAGLLYLGLFMTATFRILGAARRRVGSTALLAGIGSALVAAFVLQLSDNYFSEAVFMKMFLWLLIGAGIGLVERAAQVSE